MYAAYFSPKHHQYEPVNQYEHVARCGPQFTPSELNEMARAKNVALSESNRVALNKINNMYRNLPDNEKPTSQINAFLDKMKANEGKYSKKDVWISKQNVADDMFNDSAALFGDTYEALEADVRELVREELVGGFVNNFFVYTLYVCPCWWGQKKNENLSSPWHFYIKYGIIAVAMAIYLTCIILIMGVKLSVDGCESGLTKGRKTYFCKDMKNECQFNWLYMGMTISAYVQGRLTSYILSLIPFVFTAHVS